MEDFDFDQWVKDLALIPQERLLDAQIAVGRERQDRPARLAAAKAEADAFATVLDSNPELAKNPHVTLEQVKAGTPAPAWTNPGTDKLAMYRPGAVVEHGGKLWESATEGLNSWEPGAPGVHYTVWRDVTLEARPPAAVVDDAGEVIAQGSPENPFPFVAGVQVNVGDHVKFGEDIYRVLQAHTLADHWPPTAAHNLFQKI